MTAQNQLSVRPSLIMFDLDGTLAHTLPQLALAAQQVAKALHIRVPTTEEVSTYVGNGVTMLLARTLAGRFDVTVNDVDSSLQKQARELFNRFYKEGLKENFAVYPHVTEGLQNFRDMGIKLAVVTNKPDMFARPLLGYMGLAPYFDLILGGEILDKRKPDPTPLYYVCDKLGVPYDRALMVGDSVNDIQAGHNAHIPVVAFTYGYNGGHDVRESNPAYVFDSFAQLTELIAGLPPQKAQ